VPDLSHATWTWLRYNSPPPYPVRALIGRSVAAAYLGATMIDAGMRASLMMNQSDETRLAHIEAIFRAAREELQARHVSFVVVALPMQNRRDRPPRTHSQAYALVAAARRAGVPAIDASDPILDALANGQQLFLGTPQQPDVHFNADGHVFLAKWLHEQLPAIVATESRR
jgi:lysophospholipase L1-like esterase